METYEAARNRVAVELRHHVKSIIGTSIGVKVHEPGTLERLTGKARRLVGSRELTRLRRSAAHQ